MYYLTADGKKVDNKTVYLENQLYSSKENGKWGFVDLKDNVIVDYQYDEITEINQYGFAGIKKDGKWGNCISTNIIITITSCRIKVNICYSIFLKSIQNSHTISHASSLSI